MIRFSRCLLTLFVCLFVCLLVCLFCLFVLVCFVLVCLFDDGDDGVDDDDYDDDDSRFKEHAKKNTSLRMHNKCEGLPSTWVSGI